MDIARPRPSYFALAVQPLRDMLVLRGRSTRTEVAAYFILSTLMNMFTITISGPGAPLLDAAKLAWALLWGVPWFTLFVRRLHDQGRSGWLVPTFYAVTTLAVLTAAGLPGGGSDAITIQVFTQVSHPALTPRFEALLAAMVVLGITQLILLLTPGTPGPNRYGPDPRTQA